MKKLGFYFFVGLMVIGFSGCSLNQSGSSFSPPSWILGNWRDQFSINNYEFDSDNVILTTTGASIDFAELFKNVSVSETSSSSYYEIKVNSGTDGKYAFTKLTSTTLNYSVTTSGITVGPLVLYKY